MRIFSTFPFSEAINKKVGDYVACGGVARRILEIKREGRNEPYFRIEGVTDESHSHLCTDHAGFVSWQLLGDVRPRQERSTYDIVEYYGTQTNRITLLGSWDTLIQADNEWKRSKHGDNPNARIFLRRYNEAGELYYEETLLNYNVK